MTFYYYFVDFEHFPFQSVDSCVESRLGRARESEPAEKGTGGFSLTAKTPTVLESSYIIEPLDTSKSRRSSLLKGRSYRLTLSLPE